MDSEKDKSIVATFWSRVVVKGDNDCWIWQGAVQGGGYGSFNVKGIKSLSHRLAWELSYAPIPDGMCVCHTCDVPLCVNPRHLFLSTQKGNMEDKVAKGRAARGEENGNSKLTEEAVRDIRENYVYRETPLRVFAEKYGLAITNVAQVVNFQTWRHVIREK